MGMFRLRHATVALLSFLLTTGSFESPFLGVVVLSFSVSRCFPSRFSAIKVPRPHHRSLLPLKSSREIEFADPFFTVTADDTTYYTEEGLWDDEFIESQQAALPWVEIVKVVPPPLRLATSLTNGDRAEGELKDDNSSSAPLIDALVSGNSKFYLLRHGQSTANVDEVISSDRWQLAYTDMHGLTDLGYQQGKESARQLWDLLQEQTVSTTTTTTSNNRIVFVSSPFARARQTAKACLEELQNILAADATTAAESDTNNDDMPSTSSWTVDASILIRNELVERFFGRLDAQAIYTYSYVWPLDKFNVTHTTFDVESVAAVCGRIRHVVLDLDRQARGMAQAATTSTTVTSAAAAAIAMDTPNDDTTTKSNAVSPTSVTTTHFVLVSHADVLQIAQLYAAQAENVGEFSSFRFQNGEVREMRFGDTTALPDPEPLQKPNRDTRQG